MVPPRLCGLAWEAVILLLSERKFAEFWMVLVPLAAGFFAFGFFALPRFRSTSGLLFGLLLARADISPDSYGIQLCCIHFIASNKSMHFSNPD
jgi:hypothetical protein